MNVQGKLFLGFVGLAIFAAVANEQLSQQVTAQDPFAPSSEIATDQDDDIFGDEHEVGDRNEEDPFGKEDAFEEDCRGARPAVPAAGDDPFAPDEQAVPTVKKSKPVNPSNKASAKSAEALQKILEERVTLDLIDTTLRDSMEIIKEEHAGLNIIIDDAALVLAGINADDETINLSISNITLQSALRLMLRSIDLTYLFKNECLVITTIEEAECNPEIRIYPVVDLVNKSKSESVAQSVDMLIDAITANVAPESWEEVGGNGTIRYFQGQLIVAQSHEVHERLEAMLQLLRTSIAKHGGLELPLPSKN